MTVAITQSDSIEGALDEALDYLDLGDLVEGRRVAVKPNDTYATPDDASGVTQPDTLRAVLQYLHRFSPKDLTVTGGAGAAKTDTVFEHSGMMEVVRQEGVRFIDHNLPPFVQVDLDHGPQPHVMVNQSVLEIETLVSLAQLKVHETATVTLSLKNTAMSFPSADYYGYPRSTKLHPNDFFTDMHGFIVGMAKRFPIQLAIIVGHPAMVARGPLGGRTAETGIVIASRDPLAADVAGAALLGFRPQGVRHLWEAGRIGLGEADIRKMRIVGLGLEEAYRRFTRAVYGVPLSMGHP